MTGDPFVGNKLQRFPERVAEWMRTGWTTGPIVVDFDLTNKCPHDCPACPGEWRNDPSAEMSYEDAISRLEQFARAGCLAASFGGGGDPMAHPRTVEIFEHAASLGMSVGIITNGAIMPPDAASRIAKTAKWLRISLDAGTPQTFARVHGVPESHFARVCANITTLAGQVDKCATVGVGFLTNLVSADEILPAARVARDCGADYIQYRPFNHDRFDARPLIAIAKEKYETHGFSVLASMPKYDLMAIPGWEKPYSECHWHQFGAVVTAKGTMHVCCDLRSQNGQIGDLTKQTVEEVWDSTERQVIAKRIDLTRCPPFCRGNCHNMYLDKIKDRLTDEEFL